MPRQQKTEATPKDAPKSPPKGRPRTGSKRVPITEPEQAPKARAIRRTIATPNARPGVVTNTLYETPYKILIYRISEYGIHGSHSPTKFDGEAIGEGINWADAKDWIRRTQEPSDMAGYALVERVNGHIKQTRPWQYEPVRTAPDDDDLAGDDLAFVDLDNVDPDTVEIFRIPLVRAEIEKARLKAENNALRNAPAHNGHNPVFDEVVKQIVVDRLKPSDPLEEMEKEAVRFQRLQSMFGRKEANPAQVSTPQRSEEEILLSAVARNPDVVEKITGGVFRKLLGESAHDETTWQDVAMKFIDSGQAGPLIQVAGNVLQTVAGNILGMLTPKQPQAPTPQHPDQGQQSPTVQPPQATQPVITETAQQSQQALPANNQQTQAAQMEQGPIQMAPVDALIYSLIQLAEKQAPVSEAVTLINVSVVRNPELGDSVDEILNLSVDQTLALLTAYHPPVAGMAHARGWLTSLIDALTTEGGDEFTEVTEGEIKL